MKAAGCILAFVLFSTNVSLAQTTVPKGPPPTFALVQETTPQKGEIVVSRMVASQRLVPYLVQMEINGKVQAVTKYKTETVHEIRFATIDASSSRVITPNGKQLPIDEVWKRLKKQQVILESRDMPDAASPLKVQLRFRKSFS
jgi:DNA helicase IV